MTLHQQYGLLLQRLPDCTLYHVLVDCTSNGFLPAVLTLQAIRIHEIMQAAMTFVYVGRGLVQRRVLQVLLKCVLSVEGAVAIFAFEVVG